MKLPDLPKPFIFLYPRSDFTPRGYLFLCINMQNPQKIIIIDKKQGVVYNKRSWEVRRSTIPKISIIHIFTKL